MRKWSNEQVFGMYSLYIQGSTLREIGARHGISGQRIGQLIRRMHWEIDQFYPGHVLPSGDYCNIENKWIWQESRTLTNQELARENDALASRIDQLSTKIKALRKRRVKTPEEQSALELQLRNLIEDNHRFFEAVTKLESA